MTLLAKKAPDFTVLNQHGEEETLAKYLGKWVLLYFYPKDDTPGCTTEAEHLRDAIDTFTEHNAVVLGVSVDSVAKHKKFAEKYELPFSLLADTEKDIVEKYGVWGEKKFMGKKYMGISRTSFLINPAGVVEKVYENVKPKEHAREVLQDLEKYKHDAE